MGAFFSSSLSSEEQDWTYPTPGDVRLAHAYLSSPGLLPSELAWQVLEYA